MLVTGAFIFVSLGNHLFSDACVCEILENVSLDVFEIQPMDCGRL